MSAADELIGKQYRTAAEELTDFQRDRKKNQFKEEEGFRLNRNGIGYQFRDGGRVDVSGRLGGNKSINITYKKEF